MIIRPLNTHQEHTVLHESAPVDNVAVVMCLLPKDKYCGYVTWKINIRDREPYWGHYFPRSKASSMDDCWNDYLSRVESLKWRERVEYAK